MCNPLIPTHLLKSTVSALGLKEVLKLALTTERLNLNDLETVMYLLENSAIHLKEQISKCRDCPCSEMWYA